MEKARDQLYETEGSTEKVLGQYLDAALHEIAVTKYLETIQGYDEGVAIAQNQANGNWPIDAYNDNEMEADEITIVNPTQPYTFKDGHYMVIGSPMNSISNQIQVPDEDAGSHQ